MLVALLAMYIGFGILIARRSVRTATGSTRPTAGGQRAEMPTVKLSFTSRLMNAVVHRRCIRQRSLPWTTRSQKPLSRLDMDVGGCAYAT
jgi:hypothetical protein